MADHNHDPTPQVRMVMPIAPKGRLHSDSLEAKQFMIFKKEICCPWGLRTTFYSSRLHEILLYFEVSRRNRIKEERALPLGHSRERNSIIDTYMAKTFLSFFCIVIYADYVVALCQTVVKWAGER